MASTALLVLTKPIRQLSSQVNRILQETRSHVDNTLYIRLLPNDSRNTTPSPVNGLLQAQYSSLVTHLYSKASAACNNLDVRIILSQCKTDLKGLNPTHKTVDLVIFDGVFNSDQMKEYVCKSVLQKTKDCRLMTLDFDPINSVTDLTSNSETTMLETAVRPTDRFYDCVALGGTFDRLHNGHKILLSEAVMRCSKELIVGVTDGVMLKNKKLYELIEPCIARMQYVRDFLEDIDPSLHYRIVPITDPYGPTRDDKTIELLVVSEETWRGGERVNQVRKDGGFAPLALHQVQLLKDKLRSSVEEEEKISSSSIRMRMLGSRWQVPQKKSGLLDVPYVIGLTGGMASGKSSIARRLEKLGALVIDCDILGHKAYLKDTDCYKNVVEHFGQDIVGADGQIDRKKLGTEVFAERSKLDLLNSLVWPEILKSIQEEIEQIRKDGGRVVVLDAAVLLEGKWDQICHEVWVSIIPQKEAILRIVERNKLSEEEATIRLSNQLTNEERVSKANIVFSSLWAYEYTGEQVKKAWDLIQKTVIGVQK